MSSKQSSSFLLLLLLLITQISAQQNSTGSGSSEEEEEEPSIVGLFSGLLETLTHSTTTGSCRGKCLHTIRALLCDEVDDEADCPDSLRCCIDKVEHGVQHHVPHGPPQPPSAQVTPGQHYIPAQGGHGQFGHYRPVGGPPPSGVSGGFYHPNQHQQFRPGPPPPPPTQGQHHHPSQYHLQNLQQNQAQAPEQPVHVVLPEKPTTTTTASTTPATTTTSTATTTESPPAPHPSQPSPSQATVPTQQAVAVVQHHQLQHQQKCPGVCVTPKLAQYCDSIVPGVHCEQQLVCCDNQEQQQASQQQPPKHQAEDDGHHQVNQDESVEDDELDDYHNSVAKPALPVPASASSVPVHVPPPPPAPSPVQKQPPNRPPPPPQCPGHCTPPLLQFFCDNVNTYYWCPGGGSCCLGKSTQQQQQQQQQHYQRPPPQYGPPQGYRPGPPHGPPAQPPPPPPPRTTTTTTTTTEEPSVESMEEEEEEIEREQVLDLSCPGTCIQSILQFTCFRNAEVTTVFKCQKPNTVCCAPKSVIKEYLTNSSKTEEPPKEELTAWQQQQHQHQQQVIKHNLLKPPPPPPPKMPPKLNLPPPPPIMPISPSHQHQPPQPQQKFSTAALDNTLAVAPPPPPPRNYVCGVKGTGNTNRRGRIVGGHDSVPGEWCWHTALINNQNQYLCGGVLIGSQWVLTAAHCVTNLLRSGSPLYVRLGDHDLTSKHGSPSAQTLRVQTTYIHHNHNSQTLDNDVALLKLAGQVRLGDGVCLVCLPKAERLVEGRRCTVTGYGYMGEAGPIPLRIRSTELPIISSTQCLQQVNNVTEKQFILPASSFCAGGEPGSDACQGDGGGPFVCLQDGYYELVGLVSWGFGCGREGVPGVYVRVGSFVGWINQIISVNN